MLYKIQKMNKNMRSILLIFLSIILLTIVASATIGTTKFYGGIAGNKTNPPTGSHIDANLSHYYNTPTATGNEQTYWYIAGFWFNQTEMMNLPSDSVMYGKSPYVSSEGSSHSGPATATATAEVDVPINPIVIAAFVIVAAILIVKRGDKRI
jgi:hypothetical protein